MNPMEKRKWNVIHVFTMTNETGTEKKRQPISIIQQLCIVVVVYMLTLGNNIITFKTNNMNRHFF